MNVILILVQVQAQTNLLVIKVWLLRLLDKIKILFLCTKMLHKTDLE